jgi:hypothetical protein
MYIFIFGKVRQALHEAVGVMNNGSDCVCVCLCVINRNMQYADLSDHLLSPCV